MLIAYIAFSIMVLVAVGRSYFLFRSFLSVANITGFAVYLFEFPRTLTPLRFKIYNQETILLC